MDPIFRHSYTGQNELETRPMLASHQTANPFGDSLRRWRNLRGLSQMALSLKAEMSPRHLSFLETGRSRPSANMVLRLSEALNLPFRERNAFLNTGGFAPRYSETPLDDEAMAQIRMAITLLLKNHEPYPAFVMDPRWNVVNSNAAFLRLLTSLGLHTELPFNLLCVLFDPEKLRPFIDDWDTVGGTLIARVQKEFMQSGDPALQSVIEEVLSYPDIPSQWKSLPDGPPLSPVAAFVLTRDDIKLSWFSTVTTFGTPQDITVEELRIETLFPLDDITDSFVHGLSPLPSGIQ